MRINLHPTKCNICGAKVVFTSNSAIYHGKEFGSGKCYLCTSCGAYVGTHKPMPTKALGILANKEMRDMKMKCHELFDKKWKFERDKKKMHIARSKAYKELAEKLQIRESDCHFGFFDMDMLAKAYESLKEPIKAESEE